MQDDAAIIARVNEILAAHQGMEGSLLPILHAIQEAFGYVPQAALPIIAQDLSLTKAEVHGVMSFYHDFRENPAGRHVLKLCRAEACQSMGADDLAAHAQNKLGIEWHETTKDGAVTLSGTVPSDAVKNQAGDIAKAAKGVTSVINNLTVKAG